MIWNLSLSLNLQGITLRGPLSDLIRSRLMEPWAFRTCSGLESVATLRRLRHRDAHLALETLSAQDSSASPSSCHFLAGAPGLQSRIIHRDKLVLKAPRTASISSGSAAEKQEDEAGTNLMEGRLKQNYIARGGAMMSEAYTVGVRMLRGFGFNPSQCALNVQLLANVCTRNFAEVMSCHNIC